jgi:hypothetical protein
VNANWTFAMHTLRYLVVSAGMCLNAAVPLCTPFPSPSQLAAGSKTTTGSPTASHYGTLPAVFMSNPINHQSTSSKVKDKNTHVSVRIRSCNSCRFIAISSPHGLISTCTIGFPFVIPVRITLWKYDGENASPWTYLGRSPTVEYV